MQVIAVANHKGGVGKTTTVANLGPALAERGLRVLLVDLDPQANLTEAFGRGEGEGATIEELLGDPALDVSAAAEGVAERLWLLPASEALVESTWILPREAGYETRLRDLLAGGAEIYDVVLVDTPPGLGVLPGLALFAADAVLVPALPAAFDVRGAGRLVDYVEDEVLPDRPGLRVLGVLITQADARWRLVRAARRRLGADDMRPFATAIPRAVAVGEAPAFGRPTFALEPDGRVACAYRRAAAELLERLDSAGAPA